MPRKEQKPLLLCSLKKPLGIVGRIPKEQGGLFLFPRGYPPHKSPAHRTIVPVSRGHGGQPRRGYLVGQDLPRVQVQKQVELIPVDPLPLGIPPPTGFGVRGLSRQGGGV